MKKEKGFTLIELLAVIIILAVIALISVPLVLNIIEKAKKSAFLDSAYGIMESVRIYYVENIIDHKEQENKVFSYEEEETELKYTGARPEGGTVILKKNGKIEMAIHNNRWCAIKGEEEQHIKIIDYDKETCKIESPMILEGSSVEDIELGFDSPIPGSYYHIQNQKGTVTCINLSNENKNVTNTKELKKSDNDIKCSMIYEKEEVASLTRTFKMIRDEKTADQIMEENPGENGTIITDPGGNKRFAGSDPNNYVSFDGKLFRIIGVFEGQMKIMQNDFYSTEIAWDIAGGEKGSNNWARPADLNTELNTTYWNSISTEYQEMVDQNYSWKVGGISAQYTRSNFYNAENSKTWIGCIGLMSAADYGYASTSSNCTDSIDMNTSGECKNNNWIYSNTSHHQWTITPWNIASYYVWSLYAEGGIYIGGGLGVPYAYNHDIGNISLGARPVVYLKSNVKIIGGKGTNSTPYILEI